LIASIEISLIVRLVIGSVASSQEGREMRV
jgi:hypothetical protein